MKLRQIVMKTLTRIAIKVGGDRLKASPIAYKLADLLVDKTMSQKEIFEIEGLKMKRGRTTRLPILTGEIEPILSNFMKREIKLGMHVVDIGANIGWFTLLFSKLVGDTGHVFSFEPDPNLFNILSENIKLNNITNVSAYQMAVSDKSGTERFSLNEIQDGDNRLASKTMLGNCIEVDMITIDDFCQKHVVKIDFLKMDVQGSEPKIFHGMKKTLLQNQNLRFVSEFYPEAMLDVGASPEKYIDEIMDEGFDIYEIEGHELVPIEKLDLLSLNKRYIDLYCHKKSNY